MSTIHSKRAIEFIKDKEKVDWHDKTLWFVREKRDKQAHSVPEWENLRNLSSQIKMHTITHLDKYLEDFSSNAEKNGVIVHWAKDDKEHNEIVYEIMSKHNANKLIKSKSMLTEECQMNDFLESKGIDVVESDLGERILQLLGKPPSHIVLPAIHIKREEVGKLFEEKLGTEKGNFDPTYLTHQARKHLREEFLETSVAMTGCNFAIANTGDIVVCTNEGNADMGVSLADVHIVSMGIEKLIPNKESLAVFLRLLARSATGQPITTYSSHHRQPKKGGEMHVIIVDNGRSNVISNKDHIQSLKCLRCGACMNTCPVYRKSGGYSYTYFIPGPIGINLGMLKDPVKYSDNVSACSLCMSCNDVCPAKINLGEQIYKWRQDLKGLNKADSKKNHMTSIMKFLFSHPTLYNGLSKFSPIVNKMPRFIKYNKMNEWGINRELPEFANETFSSMWKKGKIKPSKIKKNE